MSNKKDEKKNRTEGEQMRVSLSEYLTRSKPLLKQLLTELGKEYGYVSILGTDCRGNQYLVQKNGVQVGESRWSERGFVVRVYQGQNYGEFSFNDLRPENLPDLVRQISSNCTETLKRLREIPVELATYPLVDEAQTVRSFQGEVAILPASVSAQTKLEKMTALKEQAFTASPGLIDVKVRYEEVRVAKVFLSAQKDLEQSYIWSQGYLIPVVRKGEKTKMVHHAFSGLKGVELLDEMAQGVNSVITRAEQLLDAEPVEPGEYEVICSPEITGLIAHEAFGHGVEMDMFVKKRAKARDYLGKPVGSKRVTMHDGAAAARQVSSYLFDDEGTLATDTVIIDEGILQTGISDLLSALSLGIQPTGNGKRESFERKAYARMTNTFFAQGTDRLEAMIASIGHGYLLDGTLSGMEDPKNWGIQCMVRQGAEIRDGKLTGKIVSPVIMTGYVPDILQAVSMVSGDFELFGSGACGKGYKEFIKVSDGGPYIKTKARLG